MPRLAEKWSFKSLIYRSLFKLDSDAHSKKHTRQHADNLCKQIGPRSELDRTLVLIWIQTVLLSESAPEIIFEKVSRQQQKHEKLPSIQRVKIDLSYYGIR